MCREFSSYILRAILRALYVQVFGSLHEKELFLCACGGVIVDLFGLVGVKHSSDQTLSSETKLTLQFCFFLLIRLGRLERVVTAQSKQCRRFQNFPGKHFDCLQ